MDSKDEEDIMRDQADWMNPVDERIMEHLRDEPVGTPLSISRELEKHNNYIGERCRLMAKYGLLTRVERGVYMLSELGEDYLNEELDASTLEKDEE